MGNATIAADPRRLRAGSLWLALAAGLVSCANLSASAPPLAGPQPGTATAAPAAAQALRQLADEEWEWRLAQFPERATTTGDHRYDDRLTDRSPAAIAGRRAHHKEKLAALQAIDRAQLAGEDRLTWDVMHFNAALEVRGDELLLSAAPDRQLALSSDDSPFEVNTMSGPQLGLAQLVRATRFADQADYRHYLARLAALPVALQQLQAILETGRTAGWMPPKVALARVPGQFTALTAADPLQHPLYAPFRAFPAGLAAAEQKALSEEAAQLLRAAVIPALASLRDYLANTYVPAGTTTLGAGQLPHGAEYYTWSLQRYNTTRMTPQEIHELGLREVARIDLALTKTMQEAGFKGTLAEFRTFLRTDKQFQFASGEEALVAFRDLAKRIDPQLPALFAELPRLPYGVRAMSKEEGSNAPHYIAGALDGTRAGYFEANTNNLAAWPRWTMEALTLHEAMPGHHLQIARAQELPGLPKVRRASGNSGYSEGWGLYSESLGSEFGLYADPYSRFGRLTLEAHRACRLVVDTGLHAMGWTRERAIDYLVEHGQLERGFAEAETDRYLVWPGQATAYKVGEQRILALRAKAKEALGARFDLRRFHNALLDHGALPLTVLDGSIEAWIEAEKARR